MTNGLANRLTDRHGAYLHLSAVHGVRVIKQTGRQARQTGRQYHHTFTSLLIAALGGVLAVQLIEMAVGR